MVADSIFREDSLPLQLWLARPEARGFGVHDALSAMLAERAGCDFLWVSSFGLSAVMGLPDNGLIDSSVVVGQVERIHEQTQLPIVVDMDAGFGDFQKVEIVSRHLARAGASAICIEDNYLSKRSSLYQVVDRRLVDVSEHVARLEAAQRGVRGRCAVVARTEALVAGLGVEEALRRAAAYADAGANAIFLQAVREDRGAELLDFLREWDRRLPVFVAPTCYPDLALTELFNSGATHHIFANQGLRAAIQAMIQTYDALADVVVPRAIDRGLTPVVEVARLFGQSGVGLGR